MEHLTGIDIGHGENTYPPSKGVSGFPEHEFNAAVGIELKKLLDHNNIPNFFTQQPNQLDTPLRQRSDLANTKKAKLLVSIHANGRATQMLEAPVYFTFHKRESDLLTFLTSIEKRTILICMVMGCTYLFAIPGQTCTWLERQICPQH